MRVGISTSVIQRGKTGIAQYIFALLRALRDNRPKDLELVLFVLEEDFPHFDFIKGDCEMVPVAERFRPALKNITWHQFRLPALCAELRLDLLHVPSYRRLVGRAPCPRVATIHDLAPFQVSNKYDPARMLYGRVVVKRLARMQDEIIAVSRNTAADLHRFFNLPEERIHVIHNGLEHERFFPRAKNEYQSTRERFGIQHPFFLYVARLEHPGKNHLRLIEAFENFKTKTGSDWMLALGGSDWHGAEAIHQRIAQSLHRSSIRTLGFIANEDLPSLYSAASCFVYPSLFEGFGLPPLEAMACGCPVISSPRGSLAEVVGNAAILIDPENVPAMADALSRMASDPIARQNYIRAGLAWAKEFNWRKTADLTMAVYRKACQKKARSSGRHAEPIRVQAEPVSRV